MLWIFPHVWSFLRFTNLWSWLRLYWGDKGARWPLLRYLSKGRIMRNISWEGWDNRRHNGAEIVLIVILYTNFFKLKLLEWVTSNSFIFVNFKGRFMHFQLPIRKRIVKRPFPHRIRSILLFPIYLLIKPPTNPKYNSTNLIDLVDSNKLMYLFQNREKVAVICWSILLQLRKKSSWLSTRNTVVFCYRYEHVDELLLS